MSGEFLTFLLFRFHMDVNATSLLNAIIMHFLKEPIWICRGIARRRHGGERGTSDSVESAS